MVIHEIDVMGVSVLEAKSDPPVFVHGNRPGASLIAGEFMEAIAGQIQYLDIGGGREGEKDSSDLAAKGGFDELWLAVEELFESFASKTSYHNYIV